MLKFWRKWSWVLSTVIGSILFALGFSAFLLPNAMNTGGVSGLAMIAVHLFRFGSVGLFSILINIPLFLIGGVKIGKRFFAGSLLGMLLSSVLIDVFASVPFPVPEPLVGALYGGALCGLGLGLVFAAGTSTGGSDIIVRLLKRRYRNVPLGRISACFDAAVVLLTGIVFRDMSKALYSGIVVFVVGQVLDVVIYRFDYSRVALIISDHPTEIARAIGQRLDRGATYLHGEGTYSHQPKEVILTVVRKGQLAELKELVMELDANAFVIVQEAHQVLGDGFSRYSRDAL